MFFDVAAYVIGISIYLWLRRRFGDPIDIPKRWAAVAAAVTGSAFGAKLLFWVEDPRLTLANLHNPAYLLGGKTIVGALAGGLIAVELMKRSIGLRQSTGDLYAIPLATAIAVGRIGCFLTGLSDNTYGSATSLPWAVNFGDGIYRHPTQIYEMIFLIVLIPILYAVLKKCAAIPGFSNNHERNMHRARFIPGDAFRLFMVSYMFFRFFCDFIKPYPRIVLGLGAIQWTCALIVLYYLRAIRRWLALARSHDFFFRTHRTAQE